MRRAPRPRRPALVVGLTGGLASGKSTVARLFEALGVPVIDADALARDLVEPGRPALEEIVAAFGRGVLDGSGRLDRARMRNLVFADAAKRRALEAILHPRVRAEMSERLARIRAPYAILVVPLLLEADQRDLVDRVLVVDAPESEQIRRAASRDGVTPASARRILDAQMGRDERLRHADDVLENDGPEQALPAIVAALDARYRALAGAVAARDD